RNAKVRDREPVHLEAFPRERLEETGCAPRHLPVLDQTHDEADLGLPPGPDAGVHCITGGRLVRVARTPGTPEAAAWRQEGMSELQGVPDRRHLAAAQEVGDPGTDAKGPGFPRHEREYISRARHALEPPVMRYTVDDSDDQFQSKRREEED